MLQKYYDIRPEDLVGLRDIIRGRERDVREIVEELVDNALMNISGESIEQFTDFYQNAVSDSVVEFLTQRLA
jgi:hypothetical protein